MSDAPRLGPRWHDVARAMRVDPWAEIAAEATAQRLRDYATDALASIGFLPRFWFGTWPYLSLGDRSDFIRVAPRKMGRTEARRMGKEVTANLVFSPGCIPRSMADAQIAIERAAGAYLLYPFCKRQRKC